MTKENIELRSEVLRKALHTENSVNGLLVGYLGIFDSGNTKNFGNKAGIPFKSKIDLLFDLEVLNKEEHFNLDLQMVFRNKFLHDLSFNSFEHAAKILDKSLIKKLENFVEDCNEKNLEKRYAQAYFHLYGANTKMLHNKFIEREKKIESRKDFIIALTTSYETSIDISFSLAEEINNIMLDCELKNPEYLQLQRDILACCKKFVNEMTQNKSLMKNREILENQSRETMKDLLK